MNCTKDRNVIKYFSPAWFAMVMGTGGLANVMFILGTSLPVLAGVATALWILNSLLFVLILIPWVLRWFLYNEQAMADLKHPLTSNFIVTLPAGCLILGSNFLLIGTPIFSQEFLTITGFGLWIIGALLAICFSVTGLYNLFSAEAIGPDPINYAWLMMPVVNIVVPLLGNLLVKNMLTTNPNLAGIINLVDIMFYGIGIVLFIIMATIVTNRLILHKLPPAVAVPTFSILLGPIGVGTLSLMGLADAAHALGMLSMVEGVKLLGLILWGFGLWAFVFTLAITIKQVKSDGIPFTLSWWAFIFPLGAYTLATFTVFDYTKVSFVRVYAILLTVLLVWLWAMTFVKTLMGSIKGKLFIPPQLVKNE